MAETILGRRALAERRGEMRSALLLVVGLAMFGVAAATSTGAGSAAVAGPVVPPFVIVSGTSVALVQDGNTVSIVEEEQEVSRFPGDTVLVSPNGRHVAVTREASTLDAATLEILSTTDGSVENSAEFGIEVDKALLVSWSPDSTALLVGLGDPFGTSGPGRVYRIDGSADDVYGGAQEVMIAGIEPQWYTNPSGRVEWAICPPSPGYSQPQICSASYPPLATPSRDAVLLVTGELLNAGSGYFRYLGPDISPEPLPVPVTGTSYRCHDRYVLLYDGQVIVGIYDAADGSVTPVPSDVEDCPVVGARGKVFAFTTALGGPPIVVGADGSVTPVARQGTPAAFSQDEQWLLLVDGSSVFRVASDGSGGAEASSPVTQGCSIPALGLVLTSDVIYDVGADQAVEITGDSGSLSVLAAEDDLCMVDPSLRWLRYRDVLVDLETAVAIRPGLTLGPTAFTWVGDSYTYQPERWSP